MMNTTMPNRAATFHPTRGGIAAALALWLLAGAGTASAWAPSPASRRVAQRERAATHAEAGPKTAVRGASFDRHDRSRPARERLLAMRGECVTWRYRR